MATQPGLTASEVTATIKSDFSGIGNKTVREDEFIDRTLEADTRNGGLPAVQDAERAVLRQIFAKASQMQGPGVQTKIENGQMRTYVSSQFVARGLEAAAAIDPSYAKGLERPMAEALQKCEDQSTKLATSRPSTPKGP